MNKLKIGALVALVSSLLLNVWLMSRPKPVPEIKTIEKVVTVDRIVTRDLHTVKTVSKPDGTKIVTETKESTKENETKLTQSKESVKFVSKSKWSLGVEFGREIGLDLITNPNVYRAQIGYRLWETPVWVTATAGTDKTFLLGVRVEW